ncbi:MAG: hypothetical protein WC222_03055 [Parachlamydiales bacterium]|jgi:hypothetical protein
MKMIGDASAVTTSSSRDSSIKLVVKGKELAVFIPSKQRITICNHSKSLPISIFQNLIFLYNSDFAREICPLMGVPSSPSNLRASVRNAYLGRCVEAVSLSIEKGIWREDKNIRELQRLVSVITHPKDTWHTSPIYGNHYEK